MQPTRALFYALATLTLSACSQGTETRLSSTANSYVPHSAMASQHVNSQFNGDEIALESRGKPIPVVVGGSNLNGANMSLAQSAARDLQRGKWGAPVAFVPASGLTVAANNDNIGDSSNLSPYSVIMTVNGPSDITAANLCANPALADRVSSTDISPATTVRLTSALCRYDTEVSESTGVASNIAGPDDQALHNMIASAALDLTGPSTTSGWHNEAQ